MKIILANPRGFCAGVDYAIKIVLRALDLFKSPVYVHHEIVHNKTVVDNLRSLGAIFTENLSAIPEGSVVIFSAHGVSQKIRMQAKQQKLHILDATCPLVMKVHMEVARYSRLGQECILIGHANHPEVEGTLGQYQNLNAGIYLVESVADVEKLKVKNPDDLAYVTQTTLSVDDTAKIVSALRQRFPSIAHPKKEDICYATQNRQEAVKELAEKSDLVLVVGSINSSNSTRLKEVAERLGKPSYLIDSDENIQRSWLHNKKVVGITAGASAPEILVESVIARLRRWEPGASIEELRGQEENVVFNLPSELRACLKSR